MNILASNLRRNCIYQRAKGTDRDNGYPYRKHVQDCDICQAADKLEVYEKAICISVREEFGEVEVENDSQAIEWFVRTFNE